MEGLFTHHEERLNYEWGRLFASSWEDIVRVMATRAATAGLTQVGSEHQLDWEAARRVAAQPDPLLPRENPTPPPAAPR
jgi:hypothetical protein